MATKQDAVTVQNIATERATKALNAAQVTLEKAVTTVVAALGKEVETSTNALNTLTEQVQDKQAALEGINKAYELQEDEAAYALRIKVRDNKEGTLKELLKEFGLADVKSGDLVQLQRNLEVAQRDNTEALQSAVNDAVERAEEVAERKLAEVKAENKVAIAQHTAKAQSDETTIKLLTAQLEQSRKDLDAERAARIAIEESRSKASGVVVNTNK